MKIKKSFVSLVLAGVLCLSVPIVASAASESICDGNATWYGGFTSGSNGEEYIYSKICDEAVDNYRYNGTVWAQNDKGNKKSKTHYTTGYGNAGSFQVTQVATYASATKANTCGYNNVTRTYIN